MSDVRKFEERLVAVTKGLGIEVPAHIRDRPVDWDAVREEERQEWLAAKAEVLMRRIEKTYRDATPRHEVTTKWLAAYDEGLWVNLTMFGPTGCGKTWEACAIVRELMVNRRVPTTFANVHKMMMSLAPDAADLMTYAMAPVLVLDDLGAEKNSEFSSRVLYEIGDFREGRKLPTIITTNLDVGQLKARYDPRIFRRLFQRSAKLVIREVPPELPKAFQVEL